MKRLFLTAGLIVGAFSLFFSIKASAFNFTSTLQLGSKGPEVSELQTYLKQLGFFTYPEITGYFGTVTEKAVQDFQKSKGIASFGTAKTTGYGRVGPLTRSSLNLNSPIFSATLNLTSSTSAAIYSQTDPGNQSSNSSPKQNHAAVSLKSPSSFSVQSSYDRVFLSWDPLPSAFSYKIDRTDQNGNNLVTFSSNTNSYLDTSVSPDSTYTYSIIALYALGRSDHSSPIQVHVQKKQMGGGSEAEDIALVYVQEASCIGSASQASISCTIEDVGAGNLLMIGLVVGGSGVPGTLPTSVTDSSGDPVSSLYGSTSYWHTTILNLVYYVRNTAAGDHTITVSWGSAQKNPMLMLNEYTGADRSQPLELVAPAVGTSNAPSVTFQTESSKALVWSMVGSVVASPTPTAPTGATLRSQPTGGGVGFRTADAPVALPGSYSSSWSLNSSGDWGMWSAIIRPSVTFAPSMESLAVGTYGAGYTSGTSPAVIEYNGKTYWSYVEGPSGNLRAQSHTTATGWTTVSTLHPGIAYDSHDSASWLVLPSSKRLMAFYSGHDGPAYYRISTEAESISAWGNEITFPSNVAGTHQFTYSNISYLSGPGKFFAMFRGANWMPTWSTNATEAGVIAGAGWSAASNFISSSYGDKRPYFFWHSDGVSKIYFAVIEQDGGSDTNLYYMQYDATTGNFSKADGTVIGDDAHLPIATGVMDVAYTSSGDPVSNPDISLDGSGYPVMTASTFGDTTQVHYYVRWNGTAWTSRQLASFPLIKIGNVTSGLITASLDHGDANRVYVVTNNADGSESYLDEAYTNDGGATFATTRLYQSGTIGFQVVPQGRTRTVGSIGLLWMGSPLGIPTAYPSYTSYITGINIWKFK